MSTVSGPTPMSTTATTITPVNPDNNNTVTTNNNKATKMSTSSVVTETAARLNGSSQPAPTLETSGANEGSSVSMENRNNPAATSNEAKEEPRGGSDAPLPADLKRILAEVARTGSCSWLSWSVSGEGSQPTATAPVDTATSASAGTSGGAGAGKLPSFPTHAVPAQPNRTRPYNAANRLAIAPPRKKHRNGVKVRGHGGQSRKRPLFLIRTSATQGGSVGSGRTSGSEPDDSTQYECDSEGTSATSCSELSTERSHLRNMQRVAISAPKNKQTPVGPDTVIAQGEQYRCLKDVFRMALVLVLDHWYRHKGGYKLSPAEKRSSRAETAIRTSSASPASALLNGEGTTSNHTTSKKSAVPAGESTANAKSQQPESSKSKEPPKEPKAEDMFQQRRHRLLMMLGQQATSRSRRNPSAARRYQGEDEGPPFTIQRIAEVLIAPERYYTQTHKLCNCLEKLLLVTSSTSAFGGSTGGVTSQSRLEERELAALASEKGRLESEFRQRALKRRNSSMSDDLQLEGGSDVASRALGSPSRDEGPGVDVKNHSPSPEKKPDGDPAGTESSSREMLEAAARQLRTKFDHVGIDPHSSAVANRDVRSIAENRGMTNSPPPPSLAMAAAAASSIALPGHSAVGNFVRQHHPEQNAEHPNIARVPSPILFSQAQGNESSTMAPLHAPPNMLLHHMHHAAPLSGVSVGSTPFDVVTIEAGGSGASAPTATNLPGSNEGADLEGRSSASNSDVDSESDDVSFDDSASDRSDGSDSGHYEPFTAARAMALNRIQQQQRLQSRGGILTSLALHQSEGGFRPPNDSEYQSGDSIDSTRGEDSGGSDSSSSDLAD